VAVVVVVVVVVAVVAGVAFNGAAGELAARL
jgi:hypothetical protein